jgi:predicted nuclease of predicted toxin-antitoxin system
VKFVADESVDQDIVIRLREHGYEVHAVAELDPGLADEHVLSLANREAAALLTADKDFGELVFRQKQASHGVVLIRLAGLSQAQKADMVVAVIRRYEKELLRTFSVITPAAVRIRKSSE